MPPSNRCLVCDMELTAVLVMLLAAAFFAVVLKRYLPELSLGIGVLAGVITLGVLLRTVLPMLQRMQTLAESAAVPTAYIGILLKGLGICLLTHLAADSCRDAGEAALANKAELVGKCMLLVVALPLFEEILTLALSLLQG